MKYCPILWANLDRKAARRKRAIWLAISWKLEISSFAKQNNSPITAQDRSAPTIPSSKDLQSREYLAWTWIWYWFQMEYDQVFHAAFYLVSERHVSSRVHWTSPIQLPATRNLSCIPASQHFEMQSRGGCKHDPQSSVELFDTAVAILSCNMYTRQVALGSWWKILIAHMIYWQNLWPHSASAKFCTYEHKTKKARIGNSNQRQLFLFLTRDMLPGYQITSDKKT